jgi:hypothetical protein
MTILMDLETLRLVEKDVSDFWTLRDGDEGLF